MIILTSLGGHVKWILALLNHICSTFPLLFPFVSRKFLRLSVYKLEAQLGEVIPHF